MRTCVTASTHQACVCVMVLGVCVSVSANTLSVRVCVCVNYGCVCERQHAHITIERLLWQLLPRRLQCYLVYGRRHLNTCPIFPQSPSHGIGPRISTGTTAAKWHLGRLFLQLLPLVSNKHLISLSAWGSRPRSRVNRPSLFSETRIQIKCDAENENPRFDCFN